jgi:hypothetical protein
MFVSEVVLWTAAYCRPNGERSGESRMTGEDGEPRTYRVTFSYARTVALVLLLLILFVGITF